MSRNQSWHQESGCLVASPTAWTGVASSMHQLHQAMTSTYHAKRRRASSVPCGYRSSAVSDTYDHFHSIRADNNAVPNHSYDPDQERPDRSTRALATPSEEQATHPPPVPLWQRELASSRVGRQSRASSIISTRTRLTVQSEDARSVDFEAGGQSFHISRDGSKITNTTAPPPYPGPPLDQLAEESDEDSSAPRQSTDTLQRDSPVDDVQESRSLQSLPIRTHMPTDSENEESSAGISRGASPFELPRSFRQVLNTWYSTATPSPNNSPASNNKNAKSLRRTQSDSSNLANVRILSSGLESHHGNGQAHDENHTNHDEDDIDDGKHAPNTIKRFPQFLFTPKSRTPQSSTFDPTELDERIAEVSRHYTSMIRNLDREHRQRLHDRDTELMRLRELLNEKDIVYRQQLRQRNHEIDQLQDQLRHRDIMINEVKTRAYEVEEDVDRRIEKARNEVEDMWERRWKEYEVVLREKMGSPISEGEIPARPAAMGPTKGKFAVTTQNETNGIHHGEGLESEPGRVNGDFTNDSNLE